MLQYYKSGSLGRLLQTFLSLATCRALLHIAVPIETHLASLRLLAMKVTGESGFRNWIFMLLLQTY